MKSLSYLPVIVSSVLLVTGMFFILQGSAATTTTIVVNTLEDELNTDNDCSLREAITASNANGYVDACQAGEDGAPDTIAFSVEGIIILESSLPNIVSNNLLVIDGGDEITVSGDNKTRVLFVEDLAQLTLENITVADGSATNGGAIYNQLGTLTITNSTFSNNSATDYGGGILNKGTLNITDSTFSGNSATNYGGGISNYQGTVTIKDSTFGYNSATYGGGIHNLDTVIITNGSHGGNTATAGGSIYNSTTGTMTVDNDYFSCNSATDGGGIYNNGTMTITDIFSQFNGSSATICSISIATNNGGFISNGGRLSIANSFMIGNKARWGGGISNGSLAFGEASIATSTIVGNFAEWGGGIYNRQDIYVTHSLIRDNDADNGGGIYNEYLIDITDSTFSGNSATNYGGGIYNLVGALDITNSTFSGNSANFGGGIGILGGAVIITNSILAGSPSGGNCYGGTITDNGRNIEDLNTCSFGGFSWYNTDPLLAPLGENGGPTRTHALLEGSPAIDNADPLFCSATDQRGFLRPFDGDGDAEAICDVGAFEFGWRLLLPITNKN